MNEVSITFIFGIGLAYVVNRITMWYLKRRSDRALEKDIRNMLMGRPYWPSVKK